MEATRQPGTDGQIAVIRDTIRIYEGIVREREVELRKLKDALEGERRELIRLVTEQYQTRLDLGVDSQ